MNRLIRSEKKNGLQMNRKPSKFKRLSESSQKMAWLKKRLQDSLLTSFCSQIARPLSRLVAVFPFHRRFRFQQASDGLALRSWPSVLQESGPVAGNSLLFLKNQAVV